MNLSLRYVGLSLCLLMFFTLVSCKDKVVETEEASIIVDADANAKYQESPMSQALVSSGDLPPIEERLPENPGVVGPDSLIPEEWLDWESGNYGGTLKLLAVTDPALATSVNFFRGVGQSTKDPVMVLLDYFKVNSDYTEWTFTLGIIASGKITNVLRTCSTGYG